MEFISNKEKAAALQYAASYLRDLTSKKDSAHLIALRLEEEANRLDPPKPSEHDRILGILLQPGCVARLNSRYEWQTTDRFTPWGMQNHIDTAEYATMDRDGRITDGPFKFREAIG